MRCAGTWFVVCALAGRAWAQGPSAAAPDPGPPAAPEPAASNAQVAQAAQAAQSAQVAEAAQAAPTAQVAPEPGDAGAHGWSEGDHLIGEWGGRRSALAERGVTLDVIYASDLFAAHGAAELLGHVDAALTLDSHKLGLWDGGTLYALVQNNHGSGINGEVGSAVGVSNLEAAPYTQLTELFVEQTALDERLRIRIGKQDANRDFGTPRFGGNFLNNNFGMFPNAPMPSYPTTGLGAVVIVQPVAWLVDKLAVYEGRPTVGGLGLGSAFRGGDYTLAASAAVTHHFGPGTRDGGTTSAGAWWQSAEVSEVGVAMPRTLDSNAGWFVQHDERLFRHPGDPRDPRGLTVILRLSWSRPDRSEFARYAGASLAWHGLGPRRNDTAGVGGGYFTVADQLGGTPGRGSEWFLEAFDKLRLTSFASLQPDLQWFRHPGGDGADAWVAGVRLKLKL